MYKLAVKFHSIHPPSLSLTSQIVTSVPWALTTAMIMLSVPTCPAHTAAGVDQALQGMASFAMVCECGCVMYIAICM